MKLILCRHGNTFGPDDTPVWTGSSNDLPLVEKGLEQARLMGGWLKKNNIKPTTIYAGHLIRVKKFADIIQDVLGMDDIAKHDVRLNEIDYGAWTGITDDAVVAQFGEKALNDWREKSQFPPAGQWGENFDEVTSRVAACVRDIVSHAKHDEVVLVVSSNGILRYFLKALDENIYKAQAEKGGLAVKTGRFCVLEIDKENGAVHLEAWNKNPADAG